MDPAARPDPLVLDGSIQQAILGLLIASDGQVWATDDLAREIGSHLSTVDAVADLQRAGLVHYVTPGCVMASRAALRGYELWQ